MKTCAKTVYKNSRTRIAYLYLFHSGGEPPETPWLRLTPALNRIGSRQGNETDNKPCKNMSL
jgi:hypothetical protein